MKAPLLISLGFTTTHTKVSENLNDYVITEGGGGRQMIKY